jgi:hypothetical protein
MIYYSIVAHDDLKVIKQSESLTLFCLAIMRNKPVMFKMLQSRFDGSTVKSLAFRTASENGYTEIIRLLLADERVILTRYDYDPEILSNAIKCNRIGVVRLLLQDGRINWLLNPRGLIKDAVKKGHNEIVRLLLADLSTISDERGNGIWWMSVRVDGPWFWSDLICDAIEAGNLVLLREFLKDEHFDQTIKESSFIWLAAEKNLEAFHILMEDPRTYCYISRKI